MSEQSEGVQPKESRGPILTGEMVKGRVSQLIGLVDATKPGMGRNGLLDVKTTAYSKSPRVTEVSIQGFLLARVTVPPETDSQENVRESYELFGKLGQGVVTVRYQESLDQTDKLSFFHPGTPMYPSKRGGADLFTPADQVEMAKVVGIENLSQ